MHAVFVFADIEPGSLAEAQSRWRARFENGAGDPVRGWLLHDAQTSRALSLVLYRDEASADAPADEAFGETPTSPAAGSRTDTVRVSVTIEPQRRARAGCARVIDATAAPGKLDALIANWDHIGEDYPALPGFAGALLCTDPVAGTMRSVTFWIDERHRDAQETSGNLGRSVGAMRPFFSADPVRENWSVCLDVGGEAIGG